MKKKSWKINCPLNINLPKMLPFFTLFSINWTKFSNTPTFLILPNNFFLVFFKMFTSPFHSLPPSLPPSLLPSLPTSPLLLPLPLLFLITSFNLWMILKVKFFKKLFVLTFLCFEKENETNLEILFRASQKFLKHIQFNL